MHNHAPKEYSCPVCLGIKGEVSDKTLLLPQDIVYKDELCTVFINSFWMKNNPGHVIVVPNKHFENIYDLPDELGAHIYSVARKIAIKMKEVYACAGITLLQNNEPAGGQHAFHYHLHVFPRYDGDDLHKYMDAKQLTDPAKRLDFATKLRANLQGPTL